MEYYVSSGQVSSGIILNFDNMVVDYGGTAVDTTVNIEGNLFVYSGGTALQIVENGGYVGVDADANVTFVPNTFSNLVMSSHRPATVHSGTTAVSTTVNDGNLSVLSGGTANFTTVNSYGQLYVSSGGTANFTTVNDGNLSVYSGGTATEITADSGARLLLTVASDTYIQGTFAGSAFLMENAFISDYTVNDGSYLFVSSGGTATDIVENGGYVMIADGANVTFTPNTLSGLVVFEGIATVHSGTTAVSTTVNGYSLSVYSGGTASSTTINGGCLDVSSGGTANYATVNSGGGLEVRSGGTVTDIVWTPCVGYVYVYDGGYATFASNYSGVYFGSDNQLLSSAAVMNEKTLLADEMYIFSGGTADNTMVNNWGRLYISSGGTANNTMVNDWGRLEVRSGGTATDTIIDSSGSMNVFSGGTATDIVWTPCVGYVYVYDGGYATFVSNYSGVYFGSDNQLFSSAAVMNEKNVSGGRMYVFTGGMANNSILTSFGDLYVESDGTANNTMVNDWGRLEVRNGGTATDTIIDSSGSMNVFSGGKVTGSLEIASGAVVSANDGSIIDFDISARTADSPALVNNLSLIEGIPTYTITVAADQAEGIYTLASGAAGFAQTVTICNTDDICGSLAVGGTVTLGERDYTLNLDSGLLTLTVSGESSVVSGTAGDLNGDSRADIVMSITEAGHGAEGATGAWLIQENQLPVWGNLSQRDTGWVIFGMGRTAAGKSTNDVYIKNEGNLVGAWTTDDAGLVTGWETIGEFASDAQVLGLGDFNGNGQSDLLLRAANGAVGCFFADGQGWNYFQSLGDEWKLVAIGDLNGDGRDDVVLKHDAGFAGSWLIQEDGTPMWADLDTLPEGFVIVGAGDFNGDGTDDVLLKSGGYYGAWLVQNGNAAGWFGLGDLGDAAVEQISDFNGDGVADLRIRTAAGDLGAELVMGADTLDWKYYGSVGSEWSTGLASLS